MITIYSGKFRCDVCDRDFGTDHPSIEGQLHEQNHKLDEILELIK